MWQSVSVAIVTTKGKNLVAGVEIEAYTCTFKLSKVNVQSTCRESESVYVSLSKRGGASALYEMSGPVSAHREKGGDEKHKRVHNFLAPLRRDFTASPRCSEWSVRWRRMSAVPSKVPRICRQWGRGVDATGRACDPLGESVVVPMAMNNGARERKACRAKLRVEPRCRAQPACARQGASSRWLDLPHWITHPSQPLQRHTLLITATRASNVAMITISCRHFTVTTGSHCPHAPFP